MKVTAFTTYIYKFRKSNALLYYYFIRLRITVKRNYKKEQ